MVDRDQVLEAIAAQERLRGSLPDAVVDTTVAVLRAQLAEISGVGGSDGIRGPERRRQATVLFADVAGFTAMSEGLDAELVAGLMNQLWAGVDEVITRHGGQIDKHIGDAVMGVWGVQVSREDDPERAVRAGLELVEAFEVFRGAHDLDVGVRVGVNTGPVLFGMIGTAGELSVTGDAVNVASRLEHAAAHGKVLISYDTYRHVRGVFDVRPREPLTVKGKADPLLTYVVDRAKPRSFRVTSRGVEGVETQMVGRGADLGAVQDAFLEVVEEGRTRVVTVVGEAGAGKSRLLWEFTNWLELRPEMVFYLKGRSAPDLVSVPRGLLREVFAHRLQIFDDDPRDVVARKLRSGLGPLEPREADVAGHWLGFDLADSRAVRDLAGSSEFATVARSHVVRHLRGLLEESPMVVLLEDIHWADLDSLDAVEHIVQAIPEAPLLVICVARPELFERRPDWGSGPGQSSLVALGALAEDDARALVGEVLQHAQEVPDELVRLVVEQAGGNPFHIEELLKMLIERRVIAVEPAGPWTVELDRLDEIGVPPTLTAVIEARLDTLAAGQLTALQHAAVVGPTFWDDAVLCLLNEPAPDRVDPASLSSTLSELRTRELVWAHGRSVFSGCAEFGFKHALTRDATYESVLLSDRQRLHSAAASWLESRAGDRLDEHLGPLAAHLEQAGQIERAASFLQRAGTNAKATGSPRPAQAAFEHALDLWAGTDSEHSAAATATRIELADIHTTVGLLDQAAALLEVAQADADTLNDPALVTRSGCSLARVHGRSGDWERALQQIDSVRALSETCGGEVLASALLKEANVLNESGHAHRSQEVARRALEQWRGLDDPVGELRALNALAHSAALLGHFDEAWNRFSDGLEVARRIGNLELQALFLGNQAGVEHARIETLGDPTYQRVIALYETALAIEDDLGIRSGSIFGSLAQAYVEAGQTEQGSRRAHDFLRHAWHSGVAVDWSFGLLIHAQLAFTEGRIDDGLPILAAVVNDPRTPTWADEVERLFRRYGIAAAASGPDSTQNPELRTNELVLQILSEQERPPKDVASGPTTT